MKHFVIGTTGHVDHGKTTLIKTITGKDTDSLKEERERKISIDLGFSYFNYKDIEVGIIDAPGHERFIKNTLSGIFGTNLTLLLIAANEGIKPQTLEHALILKLLKRKDVLIVITKTDLASNDDIELLKAQIKETFKDYGFVTHEIVLFNATDPKVIADFKETIYQFLTQLDVQDFTSQKVRINIDRVFSKKGIGTIVTGSLISGKIYTGQTLEHLPSQKQVTVKKIQIHEQTQPNATPFQRVALNLSQIEKEDIKRGDIISECGVMELSNTIDVIFNYEKHHNKPFKHLSKVFLHLGTLHVTGKLKLLDKLSLLPGESAYAQLLLDEPIYAVKQDIGIIRSMTKETTLGNVIVIFVKGTPVKRNNKNYYSFLNQQTNLDIHDNIIKLLDHHQTFLKKEMIASQLSLLQDVAPFLETLVNNQQIMLFKNDYLAISTYEKLKQKLQDILTTYYQANELSFGLPKLVLKSKLGLEKIDNNLYNSLIEKLISDQVIVLKDQLVALFDKQTQLSKEEQQHKNFILNQYKKMKLMPVSVSELQTKALDSIIFDKIHNYLVETNELIYIQFFYMSQQGYTACKNRLVKYLIENEQITVSQAKDLLETTRKYIVPFLEYLDAQKITVRQDNIRILTARYKNLITNQNQDK